MAVDCLFCAWQDNPENRVLAENELCYARWDNSPITKGHLNVIPKRHITSFFDLTSDELLALNELLHEAKRLVGYEYHAHGYNLAINDDEVAGQTVHHLHVHLIPRYKGDMSNPRGGIVTRLFPDRQD